MSKNPIIFLSLFFLVFELNAQPSTSGNEVKKTLSVLPVIYYTPETRWVFGAGAVSNFNLGKAEHTYESQLAAGIAYSLRKQFLSYLSGRLFFPENQALLFGELGWYDYVYFYFGQGMNINEENEELFLARFPRIRLNYALKFSENWYLGAGFRFDSFDIFEKEGMGQLAGGEVIGENGGRNSGFGPLILYDSRDDQLYPVSGSYFEGSLMGHGKVLGSDFTYLRAFADFRKIQMITTNHLIVLNAISELTFGEVPFFALPQLGGNRVLRGLFEGKYRDKNQLIFQSEYRYKFAKRWGMTLFGGLGNAFSQENPPEWKKSKFAYGLGGRYQLNKQKKLNLRLDIAHSPGEPFQFYFTFGEAF